MTGAGRTRRSEAGTTLVELIVTVAIMGFAMLAIMGGIGTSIIFSDVQRQDATLRLVLTSAAEKVLSEADNNYQPCATTYDPKSQPELKATVTVTRVSYWDPANNRYAPLALPCDPSKDKGLQLIELTATSTSGSRAPKVEVLEVVKRQVDP